MKASGRVRHDRKITVYLTDDELVALDRMVCERRCSIGQAIDRGRIVREALAVLPVVDGFLRDLVYMDVPTAVVDMAHDRLAGGA